MYQIKIKGQKKLTGTIKVSGSKNSVVALIPAALLCDEEVTIANVPQISDVDALDEIMFYLGATIEKTDDIMKINTSNVKNREIPKEVASKLRASYYFMGALLSKYKKVEMFFPGGCSIGARPINLHLEGFKAMGATVIEKDNHFTIKAKELKGAKINLDIASVGATINLMLAASKAKGTTIIENAAKEPHIVNVAIFLNSMGAKISGAGTSIIKITGVDYLHSCFHEVVPDYIETGTFMILASAIGKNIKIENIIPEHVESLISKLSDMGVKIKIGADYMIISAPKKLKPINVKTQVYPGFPTDLQQPFTILLTQANGKSIVNEGIWENRFQHLYEVGKMGANILVEGTKAYIVGKTDLKGETINATDLRAGAALIIAGLIAKGTTIINNGEYVMRGYENIEKKLKNLGADIHFIKIEE